MGLGVGHRVGLSMCLGVGELGLGVGHSVGLGVGLGVELGLSVQPWPTTAMHLPMHQPLLVGLGGHGGRWPGRLVGVGLGVGPGRLGVGLGVRRNVSLSLYRHLSRGRSKGVR